MSKPEPLLTLEDAADFYGICTRTVTKLTIEKTIRGYKVGRQWRYFESDLIEALVPLTELREKSAKYSPNQNKARQPKKASY